MIAISRDQALKVLIKFLTSKTLKKPTDNVARCVANTFHLVSDEILCSTNEPSASENVLPKAVSCSCTHTGIPLDITLTWHYRAGCYNHVRSERTSIEQGRNKSDMESSLPPYFLEILLHLALLRDGLIYMTSWNSGVSNIAENSYLVFS